MPRLTTIQLAGFGGSASDHVVVYGTRLEDALQRTVGVAVKEVDAREIVEQARHLGTMPKIEVDDRRWFYVAILGEAVWEMGKDPTA